MGFFRMLGLIVAPGQYVRPRMRLSFRILGRARRRAETRWRADGVRSIRFGTHGSASMLARRVAIDLVAHPMLAWRWYIELPIRPLDEPTREGDDHRRDYFFGS